MSDEIVDARLQFPFSLILGGSSLSGKSSFTRNLLIHSDRLIDTKLDYAVVFNGSRDQTLKTISTSFPIQFVDGLPSDFEPYIDTSKQGLLIFDDLESKAVVNRELLDIFNKRCHHEGISVILILQNLFSQGSERIGMLRNASYLCLFRSPLDQSIVWTIARRINPGKSRRVMALITSVLERYGYILITGKPHSPTSLRFRSDIFHPLFQRCFQLT